MSPYMQPIRWFYIGSMVWDRNLHLKNFSYIVIYEMSPLLHIKGSIGSSKEALVFNKNAIFDQEFSKKYIVVKYGHFSTYK